MEIKLPHMPFRFDSPDGRMEITVRRVPAPDGGEREKPFSAAVVFLQSGARALERIPLSVRSDSHTGVMRTLTAGFKVMPAAHEEDSVEFRVLSALCRATGVTELHA